MSTTEISVSMERHEGVILEIEKTGLPNLGLRRIIVGAALTPDDARDIAQQLCDQADAFERDAVDGDEWRDIAGDR